MDIQLDCLPCFVQQTLSVLRRVEASEEDKERILRQVLAELSRIDLAQPPPALAQRIHADIRRLCGITDPFAEAKRHDQQLALRLLPQLQQQVEQAAEPLRAAVQLAIAGNSLDHGVYHNLTPEKALAQLQQALNLEIVGDLAHFAAELARARRILFLGDNAGEVVLDTLLLRLLPRERLTYVVRGGPILNDAGLVEAHEAGIADLVAELIDNGDDAPGTLLPRCRPQLRQRFAEADLIIAKGQGNYETLNEQAGNIFFLLRAKCPVVAQLIGCPVGTALLHHRPLPQRP